jgi:Flp pilus assembly protein TadG
MKTRASTPDRHIGARTRRGIATIEFAICAPVLIFLMLATAEVGRFLYQYNTLVKSVRDGARYAVIGASVAGGGTRVVSISTEVRNETRNLVVTGNVTGTGTPLLPGLTVDHVTVNNAGNGFISVVVTNYIYTPVLGATLPTFGFGDPINLSISIPATVVMRALL